jgi:hypothetical protein
LRPRTTRPLHRLPSIGPLAQRAPVAHRPIWYSEWLDSGVAHRGYIYTLDRQEYGRDEAARLVTRANEARWKWHAIRGKEGKIPRTSGGIG